VAVQRVIQMVRSLRRDARSADWQRWAMIVACVWFVGGLFIDGWAHNNAKRKWITTFYTLARHFLFGVRGRFVAAVRRPSATLLAQRIAGHELETRRSRRAMNFAIVGVVVFSSGGVFDHSLARR